MANHVLFSASSAVIVRIPFVKTFGEDDFLCKSLLLSSHLKITRISESTNIHPHPDATIQIAIWSNIEAGLGITAGSLATLRPLLRVLMGSRTDPDYSSGFPGGRSRSASRHLGGHDRPFPLGSIDDAQHSRLRPDKLAVTVTTIKSQRDVDTYAGSSSPSSSEERLTFDRHVPDMQGEMGLGIHRTTEVTQTTTDTLENGRRTTREHV